MPLVRLFLSAAAVCGIAASPASAQTCPFDLPYQFNGAVAYGVGPSPSTKVTGSADQSGTVPVTAATRFNLGSVNKMMTAVAVAQLVEKGLMAFDAPVGRYLSELPPDIGALRIEQLLSHTAGLSLFLRPDIERAITAAPDARSLVPLVVAEPRKEPGSFRYSNAGYVLAGAAVEAVSGLAYRDYLARNIFPAAGIAPQATIWQSSDAQGVDDTSPQFARSLSRLPAWPAGSLVLSAPDLWRFGRALANGRLLRSETLAVMMAGGIELRPAQEGRQASRYGLGMRVTGDGSERIIGHTGGAIGIDAALLIEVGSGQAVAVLSNHSGTDELSASDIAKSIIKTTRPADCAGKAPPRSSEHAARSLMP